MARHSRTCICPGELDELRPLQPCIRDHGRSIRQKSYSWHRKRDGPNPPDWDGLMQPISSPSHGPWSMWPLHQYHRRGAGRQTSLVSSGVCSTTLASPAGQSAAHCPAVWYRSCPETIASLFVLQRCLQKLRVPGPWHRWNVH